MSSSGINNYDPKRFKVDSDQSKNWNEPIKSSYDFTNRPDALNVENVSKMYLSPAGELTALKEISFSVKKGELVSIVGPSGSGNDIVKYNRRTRQAHIRKRSR